MDQAPAGPSREGRKPGASCLQRELGCDAYMRQLACESSGREPMSSTTSLSRSKRDSEISEQCHIHWHERHNPNDPPLVTSDVSPDANARKEPSRSQALQQAVTYPRRFPHPSIWRLPNDTLHFPTLAARSLDVQTREMFNTGLSSVLIPATFAAFSKRVDQDIVAFVRDDQRAQCPPIEWTVRCYATWHLATLHSDPDLLAQSRYIYGVLIKYLQSALDDSRKSTSLTTLTVAVLMGIYEVFDGSSPDAWLVHMRGAKEILKRRGAAAHFSGFARTIVFSCRAFFIAEALISCEECFLAERAWASVNARAFEREDRRGKKCRLVSLIDRTYREVVRVPGMVARARRVLGEKGEKSNGGWTGEEMMGNGVEMVSREELRAQIQRSQAALRRLRRALTSLSPEEMAPQDQDGENIIDPRFICPIIRHSVYAASAVEDLLGRLSAMLADKKESDPSCKEAGLVEIRSTLRTKSPDIMSPSPSSNDTTSLDFIFLSLGVMAL